MSFTIDQISFFQYGINNTITSSIKRSFSKQCYKQVY